MFSLTYGLIQYLLRKDEYHILILGLDKAGKTNLLEKMKTLFTDFMGLDPGTILPTVGLNVGRMEAYGVNLVLWDLGGQAPLRSIWDKYYEETHAVMYVVDASDRNRFEESKNAMERVLGSRELFGVPVLLVANKHDVEGALNGPELAEQFGVGKVDSRPCKVQAMSARTGYGVNEGISWLVNTMKKHPRVIKIDTRSKPRLSYS